MKVADLSFERHKCGFGEQAIVHFPNGFGASVVTGLLFYSHPGAPYEIAVLDSEDAITYDTPITSDICGHLTEDVANEVLAQIEVLPAR